MRRRRFLGALVGLAATAFVVVGVVQLAAALSGVWAPPLLLLFLAPAAIVPAIGVWLWLGRNNARFRENPLTWSQDDQD